MPKTAFGEDIMEKKEIRRSIKSRTMALKSEQALRQSEAVVERLLQIIALRKPQVVALFAPLKDEVRILDVAERLDCRVLLPRVAGEQMDFYDYDVEALSEGSYGIMEPQRGEAVEPQEIDLMVVPGVAFTQSGVRLGRGKGYYDRYLSRAGFRAYCVGVCYAHQVVDSLPVEPHDRLVDEVVCGKEK